MNFGLIDLSWLFGKDLPDVNVDYYIKFSERLRFADIIGDVLNSIQWAIVKFIVWCVDGLEKVYGEIFKLFDFFSSDSFSILWSQYQGVAFAIGLFSAMLFLLRYMKEPQLKLSSLLDTILIGLTVVLLTTTVLNEGKKYLQNMTGTNGTIDSITYQTVNQYIYDLAVFDATDWTDANHSLYNFAKSKKTETDPTKILSASDLSIDKKTIGSLDINERILDSAEGNSELTSKILKHKTTLDYDSDTNKSKVVAVHKGDGFFGMGRPEYYRYSVNFALLSLTLIFVGAVFFASGVRVVQLFYDILLTSGITMGIAFTDPENNQKVKKGIQRVLGNFVHIIFLPIYLSIFSTLLSYTQTLNLSLLANFIVIIALSLATIDGSYFLQEITGIDAGIKSFGQKMQSMFYTSKTLGAIANGAGNVVRGFGNMVTGTAKSGIEKSGLISGFFNGMNNESNKPLDKLDKSKQDGFGGKTLEEEERIKNTNAKDNLKNSSDKITKAFNNQLDTDLSKTNDNSSLDTPNNNNQSTDNKLDDLDKQNNFNKDSKENNSIFDKDIKQDGFSNINKDNLDKKTFASDKDKLTDKVKDTLFKDDLNNNNLNLKANQFNHANQLNDMTKELNDKYSNDKFKVDGQQLNTVTVDNYQKARENLSDYINKQSNATQPHNQTVSQYIQDGVNQLGNKMLFTYADKMANSKTVQKTSENYAKGKNLGNAVRNSLEKRKLNKESDKK